MEKIALIRNEDGNDADSAMTADETLRLHSFLLEQMGKELDLAVEIMIALDRKLEWIEEEAECRFEALFEEVDLLRRGRTAGRGRSLPRLRWLGDPPPV